LRFAGKVTFSSYHYSRVCEDITDDTSTEEDDLSDLEEEYNKTFLAEWQEYWNLNGEKLVWESWTEKYKDYIDPEFDSLNRISTMSLLSDSSSSSDEESPLSFKRMANPVSTGSIQDLTPVNGQKDTTNEENSTTKLEACVSMKRKRCEIEDNPSGPSPDKSVSGETGDSPEVLKKLWDEAWQAHSEEVYNTEYSSFATKNYKMIKPDKLEVTGAQAKKDRKLNKYWAQRYELFSKFDDGIKMDRGRLKLKLIYMISQTS